MIGAVLPASPEGASRAIAEPAGGRYTAAGSWLRARSRTTALLAVAALGSLAVGAAVSVRLIDGLAVLAALVLGIIAVARPALAGYLLVAVVPVTAGFQKGFPIRNLNLSEALVAFIGGLVILTAPRHARLRWQAVDWLLLAFCAGWLLFGVADAVSLHVGVGLSTIDPLIGPFQFLILFRALATVLRRPAERRMALAVLFVASLPVDVLAFLQQARIAAVNRLITRMTGGEVFGTYAYHYFARATGPFPHWTPLAGYLTIVLLTGLACLLFRAPLPISRTFLGVILLLGAVALVLSAELSALACTVIGAVVLGVWAGRTRTAIRAVAIAAIVAALVGGPYLDARLNSQYVASAGSGQSSLVPQTLNFRWQVWTGQYLPAVVERPLTGWGQTLPDTISWPFTESQYLTVLMAGGVPLLVLFGGELVALYRFGRRAARAESAEDARTSRAAGSAVAVAVVVAVPMCVVYPYLTSGGMPAPLFAVAGIAAAGAYWRRGGRALAGGRLPIPRGGTDRIAVSRPDPVTSGRRAPVVFVSWGAVAGRSRELADALGGRAFALFPPREGRRLPAVVRYALSTVQTLAILARTDPRALIVTNPPIVLALLAAAWGGVRRIPFVLDSHPGSFGRQGDKVSARFVPLHRRLARRAAAVLVTDTAWAETVADWGGYGIVLHEAPGAWEPVPARPPGTPLTVLFVTRFAGDEPVAEGIAAAELVAGTEFLVTGRLDDLPDELRTAAPANVSFVGFLPFDRYRRLVEDADIVLALTTEPTSAMRSAYEAVYAGKPLVVSDFALDRELFPFAVHTTNDATSIAAAVAVAATRLDELHGQAAEARRLQVDRFEAQLASLAAALDGDGP